MRVLNIAARVAVLVLFVWVSADSTLVASQTKQSFPTFQLKEAGKTTVNSQSLQAKRDYMVVVFWTSWCQYCKGELKNLDSLYSQDAPAIVAINVGDSESDVLQYKTNNGFRLPFLLDSSKKESSLEEKLKISSFPTIYLLYRGKIIFKQEGFRGEKKSRALAAWKEHAGRAVSPNR